VASNDNRRVTLTIPAQAEYVGLARLALSALARLTPLGVDEVADLKLAVTEAAGAYVGDDDGRISFAFEIRDNELELRIEGTVEEAPGEEAELRQAIIEATVDDTWSDDRSVTLIKRLPNSSVTDEPVLD